MPHKFPLLSVPDNSSFTELIHSADFCRQLCDQALESYLARQRWFTSKGKVWSGCAIIEAFSLNAYSAILLCRVSFGDGSTELYQLPLAWNAEPEWLDFFEQFNGHLVVAQVGNPTQALLTDAIPRANFRKQLFLEMRDESDRTDRIQYDCGRMLSEASNEVTSQVPAIDSSNTAIIFNDAYFFKLFRKLDPGLNPDLELVRFLSEQTTFKNSPAYGGSISFGQTDEPDFINLGLMIGKIQNRGDAWGLFQQLTEQYFSAVIEYGAAQEPPVFQAATRFSALDLVTQKLLGNRTYEWATLLGRRTGEMHLALASAGPDYPDLVPEAITAEYREEIFLAAQKLLDRQFAELSQKRSTLSPAQQAEADAVLPRKADIEDRLAALKRRNIETLLTRIHADYHLGQVLYDESDFYIIDFEGEPLLSIPERRRKRPPFKDVAGMIRSFHYAAMGQLLLNPKYEVDQREQLIPWAEHWFRHLRQAFLEAYLGITRGSGFVPEDSAAREDLLDFFVLEKAIYEVAYELNSRPDWLAIPLRGVLFALLDNEGR